MPPSGGPASVRFAIVAEGSRGDLQPYVALALHLRRRGHPVRLFTNVDHVQFAETCGLEARGVLYNAQEGLSRFAETCGLEARGVLYNAQEGLSRPDVKKAFEDGSAMGIQKGLAAMRLESMEVDLKRLFDAMDEFRPSVVGYGVLSLAKSVMYSIARTVPACEIVLQVMLPTTDKAPAGLPTLPFSMNRAWFKLIMLGASKSLPQLHAKAKAGLGIDFSDTLTLKYFNLFFYDIPSLPAPVFAGMSTAVIPRHPEWPEANLHLCGFFVIDKETQEGLARDSAKGAQFGADSHGELMDFVRAGAPPVYLGWGSMLCRSAEFMTRTAVEAVRRAGARAVVCAGWAGLSLETAPAELHDFCRESVLFVKSAPHEVLFPHCSCIVHHGGSGTTAASVRSGRPTVIVPVMGDQYDFADGLNKIGCGVGLEQFSKVSGAQLGDAIRRCIDDPSIIAAAAAAGERLRAEDGCENFARAFDDWWSSEFESGKWLEKHTALVEASKADSARSGCCTQ